MTAKPDTRRAPRTVLMTADAVGGVWSYALGLCAALPETRFVLATMGPRATRAQRRDLGRLDKVVLAESDYRLEWMPGGGVDLAASLDWLRSLVARHAADIVHVNGYAHAVLAVGRPVVCVAHSDVTSWWEAVHGSAPPAQWDDYRRRVAAGLNAATRIVAPIGAVLRDLERHYSGPRVRAEVIPNGVDLAAFSLRPKRPVVTAAGRLWDAAKNLQALEEVAPGLAWPVEIAGEVEHPESGAASFASGHLLGRLSRTELARQLGEASIFVAPALYEPFGLAILEAAAAGCALVLGDIPSLRENWDGAAIFVDPSNRAALRSAINGLIANVGERVRLAMSARCRARQFSVDRMAAAYEAVYRELSPSHALRETT
jgi:glycogen(starch) synthase